jgi:pimeloyl-ACP methyl ester carboxylesterase
VRHVGRTPARRAVSRTPDTDASFGYEAMAEETIGFLEALVGRAHLVGWSDGAVVAVLVAQRRPDLVDRLLLIGQYFDHSGEVPGGFGEHLIRPWRLPSRRGRLAVLPGRHALPIESPHVLNPVLIDFLRGGPRQVDLVAARARRPSRTQRRPSTAIVCAASCDSPSALGCTITGLVPCSTGSIQRTPSAWQASWPSETWLMST